MRRLRTRLEGPMLLAAAVHGDQRGFFAGAWHEDARPNATAHLPAGVASVACVAGSLPPRSAA